MYAILIVALSVALLSFLIIERKLTDNTTSPRKDRKVNRNCREP